MLVKNRFAVSDQKLNELCNRWQVAELSLFGSSVRDDFGPDSDVDLLVSFDADAPWSLWDVLRMRDELQQVFGREVDLVERDAIRNPFRRRRILESREIIYGGRKAG